ncbi:MAG TPA: hypothetical protein VF817_00645 [Patescibacteria group bacterium]
MKTISKTPPGSAGLSDEFFPIVEEISDFLDDMDYFIDFANKVLQFPHLPESEKRRTSGLMQNALQIKKKIEGYLNRDPSELEAREDEISTELEILAYMMGENDHLLDQYLVYKEKTPTLRLQFSFKMMTISKTALA